MAGRTPSGLTRATGLRPRLRKAGHHWDAMQESEHVLYRYRDYLGVDHMNTLRAAANLINARRAVGDLAGAEELARETHEVCLRSGCPEDLLYAVLVNLASVLRIADRPEEARAYDEQARRGFIRIYGELHPFTLATTINYASDLAACDKLGEAIHVGHETLDQMPPVTRRQSPGHADSRNEPGRRRGLRRKPGRRGAATCRCTPEVRGDADRRAPRGAGSKELDAADRRNRTIYIRR